MLEILGKELKEEPSFDRATAVDGRNFTASHPAIFPLCIKTNGSFGGQSISRVSNPSLAKCFFSNGLSLKRADRGLGNFSTRKMPMAS